MKSIFDEYFFHSTQLRLASAPLLAGNGRGLAPPPPAARGARRPPPRPEREASVGCASKHPPAGESRWDEVVDEGVTERTRSGGEAAGRRAERGPGSRGGREFSRPSEGEAGDGAVERSETALNVRASGPRQRSALREAGTDGQRKNPGARSRASVPENARSDAAPSRPRRAGTGAGGGRPSQCGERLERPA